MSNMATTEANAAANGSLPFSHSTFGNVKVGASTFGRGSGSIYSSSSSSSVPPAPCSPRGRRSRGMSPVVLSLPLRDSALDGPASASAMGLHLMGSVYELSVRDMMESNGSSML